MARDGIADIGMAIEALHEADDFLGALRMMAAHFESEFDRSAFKRVVEAAERAVDQAVVALQGTR